MTRLAALALPACFSTPGFAQAPADLSSAAALVVERTNELRHSQGLGALHAEAHLTRAAEAFAAYMARTGKYGHEADGRGPPERAQAQGYDYCLMLENIAYHYDSRGFETRRLAQTIVDGWKGSPPHRKNMLNPGVTQVGVAVARAANGYFYSVQMLALPRSAMISFVVRNESDGTIRYRVGEEAHSAPAHSIRTHSVCTPEPVRFEGLSPGNAFEAKGGDRFVIPPKGGEVRRERR